MCIAIIYSLYLSFIESRAKEKLYKEEKRIYCMYMGKKGRLGKEEKEAEEEEEDCGKEWLQHTHTHTHTHTPTHTRENKRKSRREIFNAFFNFL